MAEIYCYYKQGIGLFTDDPVAHTWISEDTLNEANEQLLVNIGATKLLAYKLKIASAQFPKEAVFAQQPGDTEVYRYVDANEVSYIPADIVTNATYYDQVQYLNSYLL